MGISGIDVHAHFGPEDGFPQRGKTKEMLRVSLEQLKDYYQRANIVAAFVSPMDGIFPFGDHTVPKANQWMKELTESIPWMHPWVVVHPGISETFAQAEDGLRNKTCVGIKIHPDAHGYMIQDEGERIFALAARYHAVVETHSGDAGSMPEAYVDFADRYPNVRVILSHLGNSYDGDVTHQVRAIQAAKHGNLYTDVSSGQSILFHLIEWAVGEIGSEKILFGTDTPLHHVMMMKHRIETADIREKEKKDILFANAEKLFSDFLTKDKIFHTI